MAGGVPIPMLMGRPDNLTTLDPINGQMRCTSLCILLLWLKLCPQKPSHRPQMHVLPTDILIEGACYWNPMRTVGSMSTMKRHL